MLNLIRNRLASWIGTERRDLGVAPWTGGLGAFSRPTLSGVAVNEGTALGIAAFQQGVRLIADTIAAMDLIVARRNPKGGWQPASELPLYDVLRNQPNDRQTSFGFRQAIIAHAITRGNGYSEIEAARGSRGVYALHLMDPRTTRPVVRDGRLVYQLDSGNGQESLPAASVIHIHGLGYDGTSGYSPVALAAETLGIAQAQTQFEASLYGNSAQAGGHLEFPNKLNEQQIAETRAGWNATHQGPVNANKVGVLSGGMKWVQTSFSPADAELILSRGFSVAEVARLLQLPGWLIGAPGSDRPSSMEEGMNQFYTLSLLPWLTSIEQEMSSKLLTRAERMAGLFIRHDVRSLLRGDTRSTTEENRQLFAMGARSINDVRLSMGDNPIDEPWADKNWLPTNNLAAVQDLKPGEATQPAVNKPVPTPQAVPSPDEGNVLRAMRGVLADPIVRLARVEAQALNRLAKRDRFDLAAGEFYAGHAAKLAEALVPAADAANSLLDLTLDARAIAREIAAESLAELRDLWTTTPPDELPARLEPLLRRWEGERAAAIIDRCLGPASRGAGDEGGRPMTIPLLPILPPETSL